MTSGKTVTIADYGFTLMELMITIAILFILLAIAIPNLISYRNYGYCTSVETDAQNVKAAIVSYYSDPNHIDVLAPDDLRGFNSENIVEIWGDIDNIEVAVTDVSGRCPLGKKYYFSIPQGSKLGWYED